MQRIHAPFDEPTLAQIDAEVKKRGISRAQWLSDSIGSYLRLLELSNGADPAEMAQELAQLKITHENLQNNYDSLQKEIQTLKESEKQAREVEAQATQDLTQTKLTIENQWRDSQKLKKAEEKATEDAAQARRRLGALEEQIAANQVELEKSRSDLILAANDKAHFEETMRLKDEEIAFLKAHIAQLVQTIGQIALKPGEEEIRQKSWWQFWK
jgi:chromosome segregation ATPase